MLATLKMSRIINRVKEDVMPEDTQKGQEEEVLEETLEQPEGEEEQPEDVSASEEPTDDDVSEDTPELPEDVKERTKREFDKLKQHNAELKRQLEERSQLPPVTDFPSFDMPRVSQEVRDKYQPQWQPPVFQPQQPVQTPAPQLVDEQGYVNADVLTKRLEASENAIRRAEEAERRAIEAQQRIARFEQDAETKALYQEYPELDPMSEVFNKDAYELVRNELTSQIVSSGKRNAIEAANKMSKYFRKAEPSKVLEQRKAVTSVSGTNQRQPVQTDLEELRRQSRNNPDAVNERLRRLGY